MNLLSDFPAMQISPPLDPTFSAAALWRRRYRDQVADSGSSRRLDIGLARPDGTCFRHTLDLLPDRPETRQATLLYVERALKFLLWQKGGNRVLIAGDANIADEIAAVYATSGARAFDTDIMGGRIFDAPFRVEACDLDQLPPETGVAAPLGRHLDGCRIGFDLGGSDRKCAAVIDGKVVFSQEIEWDPYFQSDPEYHYRGIMDSLRLAAAHLPRVDAIGGSAAGVYIDNEVRVASLFRGVPAPVFDRDVRGLFKRVAREWGDVPFQVVNDGEVTALAGAMALGDGAVLGLAMGTSEAVGYCDPQGNITPWLNELAFAPLDYRVDAPADEWSGDEGCGVQYLSQQAVGRLLPAAGIDAPADMALPDKLRLAQELVEKNDPRAEQLFATVGAYLGYAIAHYAEFYTLRHALILGRVTSGTGGTILLQKAEDVLAKEFPAVHDGVALTTPDEQTKRHGQAIAAASLPAKP